MKKVIEVLGLLMLVGFLSAQIVAAQSVVEWAWTSDANYEDLIAFGDFDGDGDLDVSVVTDNGYGVKVFGLDGSGAGGVNLITTLGWGRKITDIAAGNVDDDPEDDIVVVGLYEPQARNNITRLDISGTTLYEGAYTQEMYQTCDNLTIGDFEGSDSRDEVAYIRHGGLERIEIYNMHGSGLIPEIALGVGNGLAATSANWPLGPRDMSQMVAGNLDTDSQDELLVVASYYPDTREQVQKIDIGTGGTYYNSMVPQSYTQDYDFETQGRIEDVTIADIAGDVKNEVTFRVVGPTATSGSLLALYDMSQISTSFIAGSKVTNDYGTGRDLTSLAVGDVDLDIQDDIVVVGKAASGANQIVRMDVSGLSLIEAAYTPDTIRLFSYPTIGDFDGDGLGEVAVIGTVATGNNVEIYNADGSGPGGVAYVDHSLNTARVWSDLFAGNFDGVSGGTLGDDELFVIGSVIAGNSPEVLRRRDTTPPDISTDDPGFNPVTGELWPPNHRLVAFTVTDNVDTAPVIQAVVGIADELTIGAGGPTHDPDVQVVGNVVYLRAERSGRGRDGRAYTIVATDSSGNSTTLVVTVPHNQD